MTYDREVLKLDESVVRAAHQELFRPLRKLSDADRIAASTLAWWRFEDVDVGSPFTDIAGRMGAIATRDASGHSNHLYAFSPRSAPSGAEANYRAHMGSLEVSNTQCMDDTALPVGDAPVRDLFTDPYLSRTHMDMVDRFPFSEWTVEASFSVAENVREQVVVSKAGQVPNSKHPAFQLGIFGDEPMIDVRILDGDSQFRSVQGRVPVEASKWYHVAATCDGRHLKLYIRPDDQTDFKFQGETEVDGALHRSASTWIVGRGFYDNKMTYDFAGMIDEVRISTVARDPAEFLFAP
jgi:hypothetical protein